MASIGELNVRIGAKIEGLQKGIAKVERRLNRFSRKTGQIGDTLSRSLTLPLLGIGAAAIKSAGDFEQLQNGLGSIMGSSAAAAKEIKLLRDEAKKPGLDLTQAVKGSVRLQSVGVDADLARKALGNFGNAIALAGGSSSDLDGVTLALTQIISKGKISAEEINQLAERVPQVRKAIENAFGTGDSEALQKKGISAEQFVEKVTFEMGKLPQATGGIKNSINNAGQAITQFLVTLGNDINKSFNVTDKISKFSEWLSGLADKFASLDTGTKKVILTIAAFAAGVGPAFKVVSILVSSVASLGTVLSLAISPMGLLTVGILAAVSAYKIFTTSTNGVKQAQDNLEKVNLRAAKSIAAEKVQLNLLRDRINDVNTSKADQKKAIEELIAVNPKYFEGLDKEKTSLEDINKRLDSYLEKILQRAKLQAANERLVEIEKRKLQIQKEQTAAATEFNKNMSLGLTGGILLQAKAKDTLGELKEEMKGLETESYLLGKSVFSLNDELKEFNKITTSGGGGKTFTAPQTSTKTEKKKTQAAEGDDKVHIMAVKLQNLREKAKLTTSALSDLGVPTGISQEALDSFQQTANTLQEVINPEMVRLNELTTSFNKNLSGIVNTGLGSWFEGVGSAIGTTIAQGQSFGGFLKNLAKGTLSTFAGILEQVGQLAIKTGIAVKGIKAAISSLNPAVAIAGGIALIALAKAVKGKLGDTVPGFARGVQNFSGGAALVGEEGPELVTLPRGANVTPSKPSMRMLAGGNGGGTMHHTGEFRISGDALVALIDETRFKQNRNGF